MMEASSKVVSFLFISVLSSQSSCALSLDHAVGMHWKCCLQPALGTCWSCRCCTMGLLQPQGWDPWPAQSWCGIAGSPGSPALPLRTSWCRDPSLAFALKLEDSHALTLTTLCRNPVPGRRVGPVSLRVAGSVSSPWPSHWPLGEVTDLLRRRYNSSRQSADVETH